DKGVSSAFLDTFRERGPESAAEVQQLVDADIEEVKALGKGFEEQVERALDQMAQVYNLDTKQFEADKHLVENTGMTFEEAVKSAGFDQYGEDIVDGVVDGVEGHQVAIGGAMEDMASMMSDTFKAANKIKSPSGLYKEIGREIPAGLALGIAGKQEDAVSAIKSVATEMQSSMDGLSGSFRTIGTNAMAGL